MRAEEKEGHKNTMSFDTEPDGDPHGQCAEEIHRLERELADTDKINQSLADALEARRAEIAAVTKERDAALAALKDYRDALCDGPENLSSYRADKLQDAADAILTPKA